MQLLTMTNKQDLKKSFLTYAKILKNELKINAEQPIIADIGANIGCFSESILQYYTNGIVHAYEPHPDHVLELEKLNEPRIKIHPYGLFNSDGEFTIGMRSDGKLNNGTYGIFDKENSIKVSFKNANNEKIYPHIVKLDVEGSEFFILQCSDFFHNTQAIIIELVYLDNFKMNDNIVNELLKLGFVNKLKLSKNDHLWVR